MAMVGRVMLIGSFSAVVVLLSGQHVSALTCENFEIIYVRGSGQKVEASQGQEGYQEEREALKASLSRLILNDYNFTELDEVSLGLTGNYEAVKVSDEAILTGFNAFINGGQIGKYARSVAGGVSLLEEYITARYDTDPLSCYVLSGYSQGAHVVGDFLSKIVDKQYLVERIKYIGLAGDPKLDLDGIDVIPGKNVPWYRGDAIPLIQGGMLGSRKPYLPNNEGSLMIQSGSWCSNIDVVCSSNFVAAKTDGHFEYPTVAIPHMALEIANVINSPTGVIDKNKRPAETCGRAKQDVVVLLDISPAMRREASLFTDTRMFYGGQTGQLPPTAGEMLARTGCGDTRFAVMGYGDAGNEAPRLLLDFTTDPNQYDALMKSLYKPLSSNIYARTPFREGVLRALELGWRPDASRTIMAITDIAGSGGMGFYPWSDSRTSQPYLTSALSQELITKAREKETIVVGIPVTHGFSGMTRAPGDTTNIEAMTYLQMIARATGGYMWVKQVPNYGAYNFKYTHIDQTINYTNQLREKTIASVNSVRGKVGQQLQLSVSDPLSLLAAAGLRNDAAMYEWRIDCDDKLKTPLYNSQRTVAFVPTKAQTCLAAVLVRVQQGTGNGCYSCPEPFPPYMYRAVSFTLDIKPATYVPKIPSQITDLKKTIYDSSVRYTWEPPDETNASSDIVYVVKDSDGSVLAATTARELNILDTDRSDPFISIVAAGDEGLSPAVTSPSASTVDNRTAQLPPNPDEDRPLFEYDGQAMVSPGSGVPPAMVASVTPLLVASNASTDVGQTSNETVKPVLGSNVSVNSSVADSSSDNEFSAHTKEQGAYKSEIGLTLFWATLLLFVTVALIKRRKNHIYP